MLTLTLLQALADLGCREPSVCVLFDHGLDCRTLDRRPHWPQHPRARYRFPLTWLPATRALIYVLRTLWFAGGDSRGVAWLPGAKQSARKIGHGGPVKTARRAAGRVYGSWRDQSEASSLPSARPDAPTTGVPCQTATGSPARHHSSMPSASLVAGRPCAVSRRTASWASTQ